MKKCTGYSVIFFFVGHTSNATTQQPSVSPASGAAAEPGAPVASRATTVPFLHQVELKTWALKFSVMKCLESLNF